MATVHDIQEVFAEALARHEAAAQAKRAMASVMLEAFQKILPAGSIVDLRFSRNNLPPAHLARVRTMRGNDRGTKLFRIVKVVAIEADPLYPDLSTWIADAVPISEKTGADMKASSGHGAGRDTVRLHGSVGMDSPMDESSSAAVSQVIELIAQHSAPVGGESVTHESPSKRELSLSDLARGARVTWEWEGEVAGLAANKNVRPLGRVITREDLPTMPRAMSIGIQTDDDPLWVLNPEQVFANGRKIFAAD